MAQALKAVDLLAPPDADHAVHLSLTADEAGSLHALCRHIGGHSAYTQRAHFDSIASALWRAAVTASDLPGAYDDPGPSIYLKAPRCFDGLLTLLREAVRVGGNAELTGVCSHLVRELEARARA